MLKAAGQCVGLQSLRHGRSVLSPSDDPRDLYRWYQILLQLGQPGIGTDLNLGVTTFIITADQSKPRDSDEDMGHRPPHRRWNLESMHQAPPTRRRDTRVRPAQGVNSKMITTSAESVRPVGTTAV